MATQPNRPLTGKEQRFVAEYVVDGDGANAARRAGYASGSAKVTACQLLKKDHIKAAIQAQQAAIAHQSLTEKHGTIADAAERREILTKIARAGRNKKFAVPAIKAMDVLNKMDGLYLTKLADPEGKPLAVPGAITFVIQQQAGAENRT